MSPQSDCRRRALNAGRFAAVGYSTQIASTVTCALAIPAPSMIALANSHQLVCAGCLGDRNPLRAGKFHVWPRDRNRHGISESAV